MKDISDPFNDVTGSTGIKGAADTSFILRRSRTDETGTLLATGRDIEYQELTLRFNQHTHLWELIERKDMQDMCREEIPDFLFRLTEFMTNQKEWQGTATQLLAEMSEAEVAANSITKLLALFSLEVLQPQGIEYKIKRTGTSRLIRLTKRDGNDKMTANQIYRKHRHNRHYCHKEYAAIQVRQTVKITSSEKRLIKAKAVLSKIVERTAKKE